MSKHTKDLGALGCGVALLLALGTSQAGAFTEQPVTVSPSQAQSPVLPSEPAAALTDPSAAAPQNEGTAVNIPGLGKIGVLPKLDFGLELLYNSKDAQNPAAVEPQPADGDLQIRGTIRHRF
jgi:hypothetical protein